MTSPAIWLITSWTRRSAFAAGRPVGDPGRGPERSSGLGCGREVEPGEGQRLHQVELTSLPVRRLAGVDLHDQVTLEPLAGQVLEQLRDRLRASPRDQVLVPGR